MSGEGSRPLELSMTRSALVSLAAASLLAASPALALTNDHGVEVFTQADAVAGGVTAGDTPGFPVTIGVGGSYRLGSNLVVTSAVNGIEVRANEVTVDMGGFTLAGSGVGRNGVTGFNRSLTVRGGTVRGFTFDGIRSVGDLFEVDRMRSVSNGRSGISTFDNGVETLGRRHVSITNSTVSENLGDGISCKGYCRVQGSDVSYNGGSGILTDASVLVIDNFITSNTSYGILGSGGFGGNLILFNGVSPTSGTISPLDPNRCVPAC